MSLTRSGHRSHRAEAATALLCFVGCLALAACDQAVNVGKAAVGGGPVAAYEAYCAVADDARCGEVYACEEVAENELGQVELCVSDLTDIRDVEARFGPCALSHHERFDLLGHRCLWRCPSQAGANAYSGSYCVEE